MLNKVNRFKKIYPWYAGFTGDLLFYIAIDTLFLSLVKRFSPAEIVSITSISQLACIALQFPLLLVIKKIGNTASIRLGAFMLLLSAIFITFGPNYYLVLLGRIFHDVAAIFKSASTVALENNLELIDSRKDFVRVRTSANTVYSVITMLIAFVASYMFNLNNYLPMFGCITTCTIGFILSLMLKDYSSYDKIPKQNKSKQKVKINYNKIVIISIILYAVFYAIVSNGQSEGKLYIQQQLLLDFNVDNTSLIIGGILIASRVIRVFSNMIFAKLYEKYQAKTGIALPTMLGIAFALILFGSFIPQLLVKILVMGIGYTIILFVRDPFNLYIQDVLFSTTPKQEHQTLLAILEFGVKIASAGIGLVFSAILLGFDLIVVMAILLAIAITEIILSIRLYRAILIGKQTKNA